MKVLAIIAIFIGFALSTAVLLSWISLITDNGLTEGVRLGLTLWPGNVMGLVALGISIICLGSGYALLAQPRS